MAHVKLDITRRSFLKGGVAAGGLALMSPTASIGAAGGMLNAQDPWYLEGPIETTYNVCDICPWRCGVIVHSVNGVVRKIDGNPKDPKARGKLCARGQGGVSFMYDPDRSAVSDDSHRGSGLRPVQGSHLGRGARLRRRRPSEHQGQVRAGIACRFRSHLG